MAGLIVQIALGRIGGDGHDITRRDSWMFAPLIAAAVTLPIVATVLLGASAYRLATNDASAYSSQPTTFASRWPSREMPTIVVR